MTAQTPSAPTADPAAVARGMIQIRCTVAPLRVVGDPERSPDLVFLYFVAQMGPIPAARLASSVRVRPHRPHSPNSWP